MTPAATPIHTDNERVIRRVSWGAIFAGTVIAMALMVFFATLGIAIGAAAIDPASEANPLSGMGVGSGIYLVVTQLLSLAVGGFAAAKLAGVPRAVSSVLHGLSVWALSTILALWLAISGAGAIFGAASSLVGNTARAATDVVQSVTPDNFSFPNMPEIASQISVSDLPPEIQSVLQENGITIEQLRRELQQAFRNVVSEQEQNRAINILQGTLADALRTPGDIGSDVNDAIDSLVSGPNAVFSTEDRQDVVSVLQQRLGLTAEEVEQIVQTVEDRFAAAVEQMRETLNQIQQQAAQAAQAASSAIASAAFYLTLASLLGILAAAGGAFAGKPDGMLGDRLDDRF